MFKSRHFCLSVVIACTVIIVLTGCMGRSPQSRFYTLSSVSESQSGQGDLELHKNVAVGVGPIAMASYLNQNKIVTRTAKNRIDQAEYDQWSGSLKNNVTNVLAENIGYQLGSDRISIFPWRTFIPVDYQVTVDIVRFDGKLGEDVVLIARWKIMTGKEKEVITMKRSEIRVETALNSFEALVEAQSLALGKFSSEIVSEIQAAGQN